MESRFRYRWQFVCLPGHQVQGLEEPFSCASALREQLMPWLRLCAAWRWATPASLYHRMILSMQREHATSLASHTPLRGTRTFKIHSLNLSSDASSMTEA
jgi:hypothetical protein